MTALESLNLIISQELALSNAQRIQRDQQMIADLVDWVNANRTSMLSVLDTLVSLCVQQLQAKILNNECTTIGQQKQYEIQLTIDSPDLRASLDNALSCSRCMRLLAIINEYNALHPDALLSLGGVRRISGDQNDYLIYFSSR